MNRRLELRQSLETCRFDATNWAAELTVRSSEVTSLICELTLLIFGKSNQLTLSSASSDTVLAVSKENSSVEVRDTRRFLVSMSRNDLEFIVSYLLAWYRDGFAEVNHIDLELSGAEDCGRNCTLVVRAEASRYPMNGEEAQRMLRELK
jgi:hypothetical protein